MASQDSSSKRRVSPLYERLVPIALGLILALMVILGVVAVAVLLGWWPS